MDNKSFSSLLNNNSATNKSRILSQTQAKQCSWPTILPTSPYLQLSATELMDTVRFHLNLPTHRATPSLCFQACGKSISSGSVHNHLMTCVQTRRREITNRHDHVKNTLARLAKDAGMPCDVEPRTFIDKAKRPDISIIAGTQHISLDISITHPSAPSSLSRSSAQAGYAAKQREYQKNSKYKEDMAKEGVFLLPIRP